MKELSSQAIRQLWLDFWANKKHHIFPSKSLIPIHDPSLLWINSGVATLKDYFSGYKKPSHRRLANSQKCIRTNDIDHVGLTSRHHTLFEMLGNFSIGDYFKKDAIDWAAEFIFNVLQLAKSKIYITYYEKDVETYQFWIANGIAPDHLIKGSKATNFWDLGQGPCGPDTEIFYDRGPKYDPQKRGLQMLVNDEENDRYIEIWNIVFSQYNNDGQGNYTDLAQKNIDTGAGLERIVSIFQNAPTNFDTDLFIPLIEAISQMSPRSYKKENYFTKDSLQTKVNQLFKIIADHTRAIVHAIGDGAKPSNTKRGYVIRRLLRRAYYSGKQLEIADEAFLYKLVPIVQKILPLYPIDGDHVSKVIRHEELMFAKTIAQGKQMLAKAIHDRQALSAQEGFKLFETYGFPIELTQEILASKNIKFDLKGFYEYMRKHAQASRGKTPPKAWKQQLPFIQKIQNHMSKFIGYEQLSCRDAKILIQEQKDERVYLLLDKTPFYATSGGQLHDMGTINGQVVEDVFKDQYDNHWHVLSAPVTMPLDVQVDSKIRSQKANNHSATHLLGYAMRQVLGDQVVQLGSENNEHKLRFDFPYQKKLTNDQITAVETKVNELIYERIEREYIIDTWANGLKIGALALENESHDPDHISRIVKFGPSIEFCGGTHVENTKIIEKFKINKVEAKGSGIFRIEAITTKEAIAKYQEIETKKEARHLEMLVNKIRLLDANYHLDFFKNPQSLKELIIKAQNDYKKLRKMHAQVSVEFVIEPQLYDGKQTFVKLDAMPNQVKNLALKLRELHPQLLIIIGAKVQNHLVVAVASANYDAKAAFVKLAQAHHGRGGGNARFAMGTIDLITTIF